MKLMELAREGVTHAGSRTQTWWLSANFGRVAVCACIPMFGTVLQTWLNSVA